MTTREPIDLCVVGASEAGIAACMAAAALGLSVMLVDAGDPDGLRHPDLVLEVLRGAAAARRGWPDMQTPLLRAAADRRHARLAAMNVRVLRAHARFADRNTILAGSIPIRARRFIVAVGGRQPFASLTARLGPTRCLTIADLGRCEAAPRAAVVLGGGVQAVAAAQALQRLGSRTVLVAERVLPDFEDELVAPLLIQLRRDGVVPRVGARLRLARPDGEGLRLALSDGDEIEASHLLLAETSLAAIDGLAVEQAGLRTVDGRLAVDRQGRTSNPRVFAVGRAAGAVSTAAGLEGVGRTLRAALLPGPARPHTSPVLRVAVTDPEIAVVGLDEAAAAASGAIRVWRWPLVQTGPGAAAATPGVLKLVADRRGTLLGAGLVGPAVREMVPFWSLAITRKLTLAELADVPLPSPAFAEAARALALSQVAAQLGRPIVGRLVRLARWLG